MSQISVLPCSYFSDTSTRGWPPDDAAEQEVVACARGSYLRAMSKGDNLAALDRPGDPVAGSSQEGSFGGPRELQGASHALANSSSMVPDRSGLS